MTKEQMDECVAIIRKTLLEFKNKMKLRELFFPYDHRPEHNKALDGLRGCGIAVLF